MQHLASATDNTSNSATPDDMAAINAINAINARLQTEGNWVFAGGLTSPSPITVIDNTDAKPIFTDGPFPESKEFLAGSSTHPATAPRSSSPPTDQTTATKSRRRDPPRPGRVTVIDVAQAITQAHARHRDMVVPSAALIRFSCSGGGTLVPDRVRARQLAARATVAFAEGGTLRSQLRHVRRP